MLHFFTKSGGKGKSTAEYYVPQYHVQITTSLITYWRNTQNHALKKRWRDAHVQCCQEQIKQTPFYVKIDCFWARDLISCVKGYFWPTWRWVNSFFDFCPFPQTFLTFFESPKKPKLPFFELGTWFFVWREVFDQHEHGSNHFLISALLRSKMALWSWAVQYIKWGLLDLFLAAL